MGIRRALLFVIRSFRYFEVVVVVIAATWIEPGRAFWTYVGAFKVVANAEFRTAGAAKHRGLVPLPARPHFNRMAGQRIMTISTRIVDTTTLHLNCDDVRWRVVVRAAGVRVQVDAVHLGSRIGHDSRVEPAATIDAQQNIGL